MDIEDIRLSQS